MPKYDRKAKNKRQYWMAGLALAGLMTLFWFLRGELGAQENSSKSAQDRIEQGGPQKTETETVATPKKAPAPKKKRVTTPKPEGAPKTEDNFTLAVDVDLVNLDVVVTDKQGRFIPNLTEKNFKVYEDKAEQKITNFAPTAAPLTVVLLIEFGRTFAYFFDDVVQPAAQFIQMLRPSDWCAVVAYDLKPEILSDFTQDRNELFGSLHRLRIAGFSETNLFDALRDTLDRLDEVDGKKAVLLLSTGVDTFSRITFDAILKRVNRTDATIYCVGMGQFALTYFDSRGMMGPIDRLTFLQGENQLKTFASRTGGKAWFPRWQAEYLNIMQQVGVSLRNQYSLGYQSTNPNKDGKFRKIKVDVVDESGTVVKNLAIQAKEGYQAAKGG
jgi:Ca-activated chloride channel family protein